MVNYDETGIYTAQQVLRKALDLIDAYDYVYTDISDEGYIEMFGKEIRLGFDIMLGIMGE